ncbi:FadR/GntR family transcriptional regulator [Priestia koreensis]|uniref:FadR/GntR family transcriptional regulator n=1 Tax=Priestia koreensis TaxID=284581 RepID=UPI00345AE8AB
MNLHKTNRLSLVEQVVLQIEELIESGKWPVGTKIPPEPVLMEELGVSRNTLREAIRALVHAGLLKTRQGDGTHVCSSSVLGAVLIKRIRQSTLVETLEVRHALEYQAALLAAHRRTDEDVKNISSHLNACEKAAADGDMEGYVRADLNLHLAIAEATHNGILIELYENMMEAIQLSVNSLMEITPQSDIYQETHHQMVEAIIEKDADQAVEAVNAYIKQYMKEVEQKWEERS